MRKFTKTDIAIVAVILALIAGVVILMRSGGEKSAQSTQSTDNTAAVTQTPKKVTYEDYNGKKIGILTGTNMEAESFKYFPDSEYLYYDGYPNMNTALLNGSIDAFLGDEPPLKSIHAAEPRIDFIKERLTNNKVSFAFRKNDAEEKALCDKFNEFLAAKYADGTMAEIDSIWFGNDDSKKLVDMSGLTGENGTLHVVTTSTDEPYSYLKDGQHVGYDIDVTVRFCREYGYALEIGDVDFQARIPALASGKYEFTTGMNVTPEREEEVLFSDTVSEGGIVVAVRAEDLAGENSESADGGSEKLPCSAFNGKTAGVITGSMHEDMIRKNLPDCDFKEYTTYGDLIAALTSGHIDFFLLSKESSKIITEENKEIDTLDETLDYLYTGAMFPKTERGDKLRGEFDELITEMKADGTLAELYAFWRDPNVGSANLDVDELTGENGTVVLATTGSEVPISYIADGKIAGTDPDLAFRFCKKYGYKLDVKIVDFSGIIPGLTTGLYDIGMSDAVITEERKESVNFSVPHNFGEMTIAARKAEVYANSSDGEVEKAGFFAGLKESLEKNFVRESRWKLIVSGIGATCLITVLTVIAGSVLAFLICMFRRIDSVLANKICNFYVKLLQGTPMVVLLMILYYVIFGKSGLSAVWVAVIGFSLNFAAYVSEILRSGIESVDSGQREAALALGYTENQAFFGFIFPQAAVRQLPVYRGEIISLLKNTSIVGYIAIQDLTKMSDIIRSRTYEAFFPLIVTAVIYFILAWIITLLLKLVFRALDPRSRKRGVKGVKV